MIKIYQFTERPGALIISILVSFIEKKKKKITKNYHPPFKVYKV